METLNKAPDNPVNANKMEVEPGPPKTWDREAKRSWPSVDTQTQLAAKREEKRTLEGIEKLATAFAPHAELVDLSRQMQKSLPSGVSPAQFIRNAAVWDQYLSNPATRDQALQQLGQLYATNYQPQQTYQQSPNEAQIAQVLHEFSQDKPHFEQVRVTMGQLMQGGLAADLQTAYDQALKLHPEIAAENERKRNAGRMSSGRSPSGSPASNKRGNSVRAYLDSAIAEYRGR